MCVLCDLAMVECQWGQFGDRKPCGIGSICSGAQHLVVRYKCIIPNRDNTSSRIALWITKRIELFEIHFMNARFLAKLTTCRSVERLVFQDETSWKGVAVFERLSEPFDQQKMQL